MELLVAQLLNGLVYGVLLFLMAAGLSLIFGLMNVVSLAHGSFFMLGAFLGLAILKLTGSFWIALLLAPLAGRASRHRHGGDFPAAALCARPHGPGAADLRLHLRVLRPGADDLGPHRAAPADAGKPARHRAYRRRRVLGLSAVPDRLRLRHRAAALARARTQPDRRHGARRRRQCRRWRRVSAAISRCSSPAYSASASRWRGSAASRPDRSSAFIRAWIPTF